MNKSGNKSTKAAKTKAWFKSGATGVNKLNSLVQTNAAKEGITAEETNGPKAHE